ncbi:MgtC/SapB family protein [Mesorhizobium sp. RP14(2022)]|uniref:Protein MgtC n=1 Tax=Mesorhizobium liriopis TaxID=2953882 RepID=A0ABT1C8G8_9HYPH|nr:MgtC/SapB family protein [Mesorhizobium liriopis]MCO6051131.1 MgtC/SapB family protein [Mesorhizobium liriopis]
MFSELADEFTHPTFTAFPVIVARLLFAAGLGALIGFEREWRNHPAGLRTHILVCLSTATIAILTIELAHSPVFRGEEMTFDPIRMVEATTAGIAFLAAGLIVFARGKVKGLTTGAGLWFAGAIGLCCGLGLWQIALFATLLSVVVLGVLGFLTDRLEKTSPDDERMDGAMGGPMDGPMAGSNESKAS